MNPQCIRVDPDRGSGRGLEMDRDFSACRPDRLVEHHHIFPGDECEAAPVRQFRVAPVFKQDAGELRRIFRQQMFRCAYGVFPVQRQGLVAGGRGVPRAVFQMVVGEVAGVRSQVAAVGEQLKRAVVEMVVPAAVRTALRQQVHRVRLPAAADGVETGVGEETEILRRRSLPPLCADIAEQIVGGESLQRLKHFARARFVGGVAPRRHPEVGMQAMPHNLIHLLEPIRRDPVRVKNVTSSELSRNQEMP